MRRLFFLIGMPLAFDACVASVLAVSGTPAASAPRDYVALHDWDRVALTSRRAHVMVAAQAIPPTAGEVLR